LGGLTGRLEHAAEGLSAEQIAEFEVFAEHVETLVAAEPFEFGGMHAAFHAGRQCPALEAVAAKIAQPETGRDGAGLDDLHEGLRRDCHGADPGQGRRPALVAAAARCGGTLGRR
jgi:hypothetical protein